MGQEETMRSAHSWRVLAVLCIATLAVLAQRGPYAPYRERLADGVVDWDEGWVRADVAVPLPTGQPPAQAKVSAQRVAIVKAQAAALRIALRLPLNSQERLEANEALRVRLKGIVSGGQTVAEGIEGRTYKLSLKVPINGVSGIVAEVSKVVLPPEPPAEPRPEARTKESAQAAPPPAAPPAQGAQEVAPVVVDAVAAGVKPALQPRILDPKGNEVYGVKTVKPLVARSRTLARFVTPEPGASPSLWPKLLNGGPAPLALIWPAGELLAQREPSGRKRGSAEPVTVTAAGASGPLKADIVVTEEAAQKLRAAEAASGALSEGRVVVVVRADVGGVESRRFPPPESHEGPALARR
jgi:hypothetical protein